MPKFLLNKIIVLTLLLVINGFFFVTLNAQTNNYTGASGGNWNTPSNWSQGVVPTTTHDVTIPNGVNVTVNTAAVCKTFTINGGNSANTVSIGANSLSVTNAVTINTPTALLGTTKEITISTGTLSCGSISMTNSNFLQTSSITMTGSGTITVSGNITMASYCDLNIDGNGILNLGGTMSGGTFSSSGNNSTVNFNGTSAQTIPINTYTFNKIITSNTHASGATLGAAITTSNVTDNITIQTGIFNNGGFAIAGNSGKIFTIANGATFKISGTTSAFPSGFTTNTLEATSTVKYSGSGNQTVFDVPSPGYGHLILSGGSTKTGSTNGLEIQGNVTVNNGSTFALTSFTYNISGNLLNSGIVTATTATINLTGNWTNDGTFTGGTTTAVNITGDLTNTGTFTAGTGASNLNVRGNWSNNGTFTSGSAGTVTFNSTSTGKTISGTLIGATGKFYNLIFNGIGGGWTIGSSLDVANTFAITNGNVLMNGVLTLSNASAFPALGGTLTLENNASLIQSGYTGINSGSINVKRNSTPIILDDYTYWSSPTTGSQTLLDFSPNTQLDKFFTYNNGWAFVIAPNSDTFVKGIGYAIRSPEGISTAVPAVVAHQFTGVPNNGNVDVALTVGSGPDFSGRVIGNPYPSAIDADAFIHANTITIGTINQTISGTLYFWTHNHGLTGVNYSASDYAAYNLTGGTAVGSGTGNTTAPTQYIASGQGFFIRTDADGNVSFRNAMRVGVNNDNFYKSPIYTAATPPLESHRIWLNLTNSTAGFSQILLGYIETATNGYDPGFDGLYFGDNLHVLYSFIDDKKYAIQARALPFSDTDVVQVGYMVNTVGSTTISIDHIDGLFLGSQNIYLEDKLLNVTHDLKLAPYTFESEAGTFDNRFLLRYVNSPLGLENFNLSNGLIVASKNKVITIKSQIELIDKIFVYDILGRQLFENKNVNSNEVQITDLAINQALIIKTVLANGDTINKKLVY